MHPALRQFFSDLWAHYGSPARPGDLRCNLKWKFVGDEYVRCESRAEHIVIANGTPQPLCEIHTQYFRQYGV